MYLITAYGQVKPYPLHYSNYRIIFKGKTRKISRIIKDSTYNKIIIIRLCKVLFCVAEREACLILKSFRAIYIMNSCRPGVDDLAHFSGWRTNT